MVLSQEDLINMTDATLRGLQEELGPELEYQESEGEENQGLILNWRHFMGGFLWNELNFLKSESLDPEERGLEFRILKAKIFMIVSNFIESLDTEKGFVMWLLQLVGAHYQHTDNKESKKTDLKFILQLITKREKNDFRLWLQTQIFEWQEDFSEMEIDIQKSMRFWRDQIVSIILAKIRV